MNELEPTLIPHRDSTPETSGIWHGQEWGTFTTIGGYRYRDGKSPCILCEDTTTLRRFIITAERWASCRKSGAIKELTPCDT